MAPKADKPKRAKGSMHLVGPRAKGMASFATCGAYVLSTKQTAKREEVGCKECWAMLMTTPTKTGE